MGSNISEIVGTPEEIPKDFLTIQPKHKTNYKDGLIDGLKILKGFAKHCQDIDKIASFFNENTQLLNSILFPLFSAMPIIGTAVSFATVVAILLLKLFTNEVKMSTQEICKQEIAFELSSYLFVDIQGLMDSALSYIDNNNYIQAELQSNTSFHKLKSFLNNNKFMQWARNLPPSDGLRVLFYFYKISLMVGNIYLALDYSENKNNRKEEVDSLVNRFRNQVLDFRGELIIFDSVSTRKEQIPGTPILSTIDEYIFEKVNFQDKLFPTKKYTHSFSLSNEEFFDVSQAILNYRKETLKLWNQQLDYC